MFGAVSRASRHSGGVQVCFNNGSINNNNNNNSNNIKSCNVAKENSKIKANNTSSQYKESLQNKLEGKEFSGSCNHEALLATSFFADDYSGPAETKLNGVVGMRALTMNEAEMFFIRENTFDDRDKYKDNNLLSLMYKPKDILPVVGGSSNSYSTNTNNLSANDRSVSRWSRSREDVEDMTNSFFEVNSAVTDDQYSNTSSSSNISSSNNNNNRFKSRSGGSGGEERPYCRLCGSLIEFHGSSKFHMVMSSKINFTNHVCREVLFESLYMVAIRGYPIEHMELVWSNVLYNSPMFTRIPKLIDRTASIEKRATQLLDLLSTLKNAKILDLCFNVTVSEGVANENQNFQLHRRRIGAERLEYIGDSLGAFPIIHRLYLLFPEKEWQYSSRVFMFNSIRESLEMNATLSYAFDVLQMNSLNFGKLAGSVVGLHKGKADFMEAMIGELRRYVFDFVPEIDDDVPFMVVNGAREREWYAIIEHCLNELYDLIILCALREMSWRCIPLAQELAADYLWVTAKRELSHVRVHRPPRQSFIDPKITDKLLTQTSSLSEEEEELLPSQNASNDINNSNEGECTQEKVENDHCLNEYGNSSNMTVNSLLKDNTIIKTMANVFVLPANVELSTKPYNYPVRVPHPLLHEPDPVTYELTSSEYSKRDYFDAFHASFLQLGLINEDAHNMAKRVHRPQYHKFITQLVPNVLLTSLQTLELPEMPFVNEKKAEKNIAEVASVPFTNSESLETNTNMEQAEYASSTDSCHNSDDNRNSNNVSSSKFNEEIAAMFDGDTDNNVTLDATALASIGNNSNNNSSSNNSSYKSHHENMEQDVFFADPYYDLFPHKMTAYTYTRNDMTTDKNKDDVNDMTCTMKSIQRAAHLPILTPCNPLTSTEDRLVHALSSIYPFLQASPSEADRNNLANSSKSDGSSHTHEPECVFASSSLVPSQVKPPSAGVITDRNLYKGQFAF